MKSIKNLSLVLLITLSINNLFAMTKMECLMQAESYGDGRGGDYINPSCLQIFDNFAHKNAKVINLKKTYKITGYKTIVFIKNLIDNRKKLKIYAGSNTTLNEASAVAFDEVNNEFALLDAVEGRVLFFSSIIDGNVAPIRILKSDLLINADGIFIDSRNDQVMIANHELEQILIFSRFANISARQGKKKLELIKTIDNISDEIESMRMEPERNELIIKKKYILKTQIEKL